MDERGELVFLILDCSNASWAKANANVAPSKRCSFTLALESLILLQNAIELFHADNETVLMAACHPAPRMVTGGVEEFIQLSQQTGSQEISVTKALLTTLCVANRRITQAQRFDTQIRFVLITASPVPTTDFVTCMNCAFAAQKLGIVIDVFDFSQNTNSPTLMQLVHHTEGWYVNAKDASQGVLAHMLLAYFSASLAQRTIPPMQLATDMRSVCFCHQKLINIGYVCSVCLAVFCEKPAFLCKACSCKVSRPLAKKETQRT